MKLSESPCFSTSTKETAIQIHLHGVADVGLNAVRVIFACTLFTGRAVQVSKGPCDNWLFAVRTSR